MKVRPASAAPEDWDAVKDLLVRCALPPDGAKVHLAGFLLVHDGASLVACSGLEYYEDVALLRSVAVDSDHRGRGLGKSLVAELLASAAKRGIGTVILLTTTAVEFFQRMGFSIVPRSSLPQAVMASAEFRGACPDTATVMKMTLGAGTTKVGQER